MTQNLAKDVFTFTWSIENFSMCPHKNGELITSPAFVVDVLEKKEFILGLFPKGLKSYGADFVAGMLCWRNCREDPEEIAINFSLSLVTADRQLLKLWSQNNQVIKKTDCPDFATLVTMRTLFANKKSLLPKDVLTLQLCIRPASDPNESPEEPKESTKVQDPTFSLEEVSSVVSDDSMMEHCRTNSFLNTRIPIERRRVKWTIRNFDSILKTKKRIHVSVESKVRWKSALLLSCYVSEDGNSVRMDIQRKDRDFTQIFVRCKVFVLDGSNIAQAFQEDEHLFGKHYETWSFPPIIKLVVLEKSRHVLLPDDTLSLRCEFLVSYKGEEDTFIGPERKTHNSISTDDLRRDFVKLLNDREFTDVTLVSEGFEIVAHKVVLCAQSPVFRAMFRGDTCESTTGVVQIDGVDAETVNHLIHFMYQGLLPDLRQEDAFKLYSAAAKYQVSKLRNQCATILKYNLSLYSVCDVLVMADRHKDSDLMTSVLNFLRIHQKDVFQLKQWNKLMQNNTILAEGIKYMMLTPQ